MVGEAGALLARSRGPPEAMCAFLKHTRAHMSLEALLCVQFVAAGAGVRGPVALRGSVSASPLSLRVEAGVLTRSSCSWCLPTVLM